MPATFSQNLENSLHRATRLAEEQNRKYATPEDLLIAYAKQETIDPLKGLARWVGFGLVWLALVIMTTDGLVRARRNRVQVRQADVEPAPA